MISLWSHLGCSGHNIKTDLPIKDLLRVAYKEIRKLYSINQSIQFIVLTWDNVSLDCSRTKCRTEKIILIQNKLISNEIVIKMYAIYKKLRNKTANSGGDGVK